MAKSGSRGSFICERKVEYLCGEPISNLTSLWSTVERPSPQQCEQRSELVRTILSPSKSSETIEDEPSVSQSLDVRLGTQDAIGLKDITGSAVEMVLHEVGNGVNTDRRYASRASPIKGTGIRSRSAASKARLLS